VANLLHDGLIGTPTLHFIPPTIWTAYGHSWNARGWGRGQWGQSPWDRMEAQKKKDDARRAARHPDHPEDARRPGGRRR